MMVEEASLLIILIAICLHFYVNENKSVITASKGNAMRVFQTRRGIKNRGRWINTRYF